MPVVTTCTEHPDWTGEVYYDCRDHLDAHHGGLAADAAERSGLLSTTLVPQHRAYGRPGWRVFYCTCGTRIEISADDTDHPLDRCVPCTNAKTAR